MGEKIEVDISAAVSALRASPELADEMNKLVGGPALVEALAEIEKLRTRLGRLLSAVHKVYYAAVWTPDRDCDAKALWTELRDAGGFPVGSSTELLRKENKSGTAANAEGQS